MRQVWIFLLFLGALWAEEGIPIVFQNLEFLQNQRPRFSPIEAASYLRDRSDGERAKEWDADEGENQDLEDDRYSYDFFGKHFIASYYGCSEEAMTNREKLEQAMIRAARASGATILDTSDFHLEGDGYTLVILLSESHASIHTYPEHHACFIDLFTCGDTCSYERFHKVLSRYLKPADAHIQILRRS